MVGVSEEAATMAWDFFVICVCVFQNGVLSHFGEVNQPPFW